MAKDAEHGFSLYPHQQFHLAQHKPRRHFAFSTVFDKPRHHGVEILLPE
jgi:hypothetical protein